MLKKSHKPYTIDIADMLSLSDMLSLYPEYTWLVNDLMIEILPYVSFKRFFELCSVVLFILIMNDQDTQQNTNTFQNQIKLSRTLGN